MRLFLAVLALTVAACGSRRPEIGPPTAPSATPEKAEPVRAFVSTRLTGAVRDESGAAVPDATITVYTDNFGRVTLTTNTNAGGRYDVTFDTQASGWYVTASKAGYETNEQFVGPPQSLQDFRLFRIVKLMAGSRREVVITEADSLCGISSEWRCRTIRVVSPGNGTMSAEAVPGNAGESVGIEVYRPRYACCNHHFSISMTTDQELSINVLVPLDSPVPRTVTLRTELSTQ